MEFELTNCPDCGLPAEVIHRSTLQSTDGPIDHLKIRCVSGRWFMLPVDDLSRPSRAGIDPVRHHRASTS